MSEYTDVYGPYTVSAQKLLRAVGQEYASLFSLPGETSLYLTVILRFFTRGSTTIKQGQESVRREEKHRYIRAP